jgi:hypothetical protein
MCSAEQPYRAALFLKSRSTLRTSTSFAVPTSPSTMMASRSTPHLRARHGQALERGAMNDGQSMASSSRASVREAGKVAQRSTYSASSSGREVF